MRQTPRDQGVFLSVLRIAIATLDARTNASPLATRFLLVFAVVVTVDPTNNCHHFIEFLLISREKGSHL